MDESELEPELPEPVSVSRSAPAPTRGDKARPAAAAAASNAASDSMWIESLDDETGKPYWIDLGTGLFSWTDPNTAPASTAASKQPVPKQRNAGRSQLAGRSAPEVETGAHHGFDSDEEEDEEEPERGRSRPDWADDAPKKPAAGSRSAPIIEDEEEERFTSTSFLASLDPGTKQQWEKDIDVTTGKVFWRVG